MKKILKKYLKKYLKKNLKCHPEKNYFFLRWLVEFVNDVDAVKYFCRAAAVYERNNDRGFKADFNDIFIIDDDIYIYTHRPGLWIGSRGCIVEDLREIFIENYNTKRDYVIHFIEDVCDTSTSFYRDFSQSMNDW